MTPKLTLALLAAALIVPTAGCGSTSANPISSGGSGGTGGTGTTTSTGTGATGGSAGTACDPACGAGAVCVDGACHTIAKLDTTGAVNADGCRIVVDADNVYWMTQEVRRVPKTGGAAAILDDGTDGSGGLVVDDTYLYWTDLGIMRVAKDAPPVPGTTAGSPFADEGGAPTEMVGDGTSLYFIESGSIDKVGTAGPPDPQAPPTPFLSSWGGGTTPIGVDATNVYFWTEAASVLTRMVKATQWAGNIGSRENGVVGPDCGVVPDGTGVFYSTAPTPGAGGFITFVDTATLDATPVVDTAVGATGVFAVDADSVWFTTPSEVMKVGKTGGTAVSVSPLALTTPFPSCMAADDTYVYWVDGLTLMQYRK